MNVTFGYAISGVLFAASILLTAAVACSTIAELDNFLLKSLLLAVIGLILMFGLWKCYQYVLFYRGGTIMLQTLIPLALVVTAVCLIAKFMKGCVKFLLISALLSAFVWYMVSSGIVSNILNYIGV